MFKADYHVHSSYSFDGNPKATIEAILKTAANRELDEVAVCDHYDVNQVIAGNNPDINFCESKKQIGDAEKTNKTHTKILLGIELGQPNQCPDKAAEVLAGCDFDFILCALHNARGEDDFYYIDYKNADIRNLIRIYEKYTEELCELACWGKFHALAHATYPLRYFMLNDIYISVRRYTDLYIKLFKILIHRGIALEVNTSGLRKKINQPSPSYKLLKLYKELGGELITVGSDAHKTQDIFTGIKKIYGRLSEIGFKYITTVKDKKLTQVKIDG